MSYTIRKFQPETDVIKPFDCGDADLNGFLVETSSTTPNATMYEKQRLAVTYVVLQIPGSGTAFREISRMQSEDLLILPSKWAVWLSVMKHRVPDWAARFWHLSKPGITITLELDAVSLP